MRTFAIGDIHGEYEKLINILSIVNFDYNEDKLISIGDVVDRGPKSFECVEELLKINHLIAIRGNHDKTWYDSTITGKNELYSQGGRETLLSYTRNGCENDPTKIPQTHKDFFKNQLNYYIDVNNNLFIHGGFNRHQLLEEQEEYIFYWDRDLFMSALSNHSMINNQHQFRMKTSFNKIFVGHTPTIYWGFNEPIKALNIWNIDTGCGKGDNFLTIMNVDTEEYFQSK
jgi:serine/threonine protein phosphatase 1